MNEIRVGGGGEGTGSRVNLPTFRGNFSLLPKLGLKIGGGQHTTPALIVVKEVI